MSLVWSTPIVLSGLGLTPASIGLWLSAYGCASALPVPVLSTPRRVFWPGARRHQLPVPVAPADEERVTDPVRLTDSIASKSITPYINQIIGELPIVGGDGRKVGYYTGITVICILCRRSGHRAPVKPPFRPRQAQTYPFVGSSQDNRLDHHVRALALFWRLALCRFLSGALNGNIGISKGVLAKLTDDSNVARGFSLLPLVAVVGYVIGFEDGSALSSRFCSLIPLIPPTPSTFHWRCLITISGPLARVLLTPVLVRIPILLPMSGGSRRRDGESQALTDKQLRR
ncbi:hypothetical protein EDB84DRAFT_1583664 [Lactarius hengduanensis]|nr:hypothetical protein EDB84DRAFT_1583664 [Lactarius hengduanensis]